MSKPNADLTVIRNVDEKSWANEQVDSVNRLGKDAPFIDKYGASKILAEQGTYVIPSPDIYVLKGISSCMGFLRET